MKISEQLDNVEEKLGGQFDIIMCAATLVGHGVLTLEDTMQRANRYFDIDIKMECVNCPCFANCIIVKREE